MNVFILNMALPPAAYIIGSIPFGLLFVRMLTKSDIRSMGSGNIGATNVKRAVGTKWAAITLVCDALKGIIPVLAALSLSCTTYGWLPAITALAAVAGHMYPLYFGFRPGGKGVATTLGCLLTIAPWACLIAILIFIPAVYWSKRVSVASLAATVSMPPATWFTTQDPALTIVAIIIMALVLSRHHENLKRLAQGVESVVELPQKRKA